ncbi:MAG: flagellar biosynthetic protein FliO [Gammaproteobacteria bacterium]|nr:flagellar biosynthetic protein FliO [Gammaproteobacteria bacterium]
MHWFTSLLVYLPTVAVAQQASSGIAVVEPLSTSYLIKLTGGLILVVVIIFCFAWLLKRLKITQQAQNGLLKVVAGLPLGTRERIVVLQVGEEQILLGLSPGRIEKLHTLAEPLVVDPQQSISPFAERLHGLINRSNLQ